MIVDLTKAATLDTVKILYNDLRDRVKPAEKVDQKADLVVLALDYEDLIFPVTSGTLCTYNGKLKVALQDISEYEEFNPTDWNDARIADILVNYDGAENRFAPIIINAKTGQIIDINDGADNLPVQSLVTRFSPVQDLHGQSAPYPPGGGKNICPEINKYSVNNFVTPLIALQAGVTYTFSCVAPVSPSAIYLRKKDDISLTGEAESYVYNKTTFTFTPEYTGTYLLQVYKSGVEGWGDDVVTDGQIELGSTATAFAPYSNICPISGWTGVTAWRTGKNLINLTADDIESTQRCTNTFTNGGISLDATGNFARTRFHIKVKNGNTYTLSFNGNSTGNYNRLYLRKDAVWSLSGDGFYVQKELNSTETACTMTFTATSDDLYICMYCTAESSSGTMTLSNLQLELGSEATAFESYTGQKIAVDWTDEAGTVYGGTLDLTTGVLTVGWMTTAIDSLVWTYNTEYKFFTHNNFDERKVGVLNVMSDLFKTEAGSWSGTPKSNAIWGNGSNGTIYVQYPVETLEEFNQLITGHQLVYELATPITIQLTPIEIRTLLGRNVIWADTNGDTDIAYRADTKQYVLKNMPDVQINSSSILQNGIANIPYASSSNYGVIKTNSSYGIQSNSSGVLSINHASSGHAKGGSDSYRPITPDIQHASIFYGLSKLASVDLASGSDTIGVYPSNSKQAIQKLFGLDGIFGNYESATASKAYAIGETFIYNGKRYRATAAIAQSDVIAPGTNCELDPLNGDYLKKSNINTNYGLYIRYDGSLAILAADANDVKSGSDNSCPLTSYTAKNAVYYGLAKAAGADMASASGETVGVYPQAQKTAIQSMLGIEANIPLVETVTGATVSITGMPNVRYICETAISELTITPPASGSIVVRFTAGSGCIVVLPQTVQLPEWFDISSLEAGTTYEIIITDGVYGGVMSWAA